jgi:hypothetical protein
VRIGVTGHQWLPNADWAWVEATLVQSLAPFGPSLEGWTSLAIGTDQIFARAVLGMQGTLVTVIPLKDYERFYSSEDAVCEYHRLLRSSSRIVHMDAPDEGEAFLAAGKRIVDECHEMFAVWDGLPSPSLGSTGDIVEYARLRREPLTIIDPVSRVVRDGLA